MTLEIMPTGRRWALYRSGYTKAVKLFDNQTDALEHARSLPNRPIKIYDRNRDLVLHIGMDPAPLTATALQRLADR